jgi:hypothetical protein
MRPIGEAPCKLTAEDGRLLCLRCHAEKTTTRDLPDIALAKRQEAYALGIEKPGKRKIRRRKREKRPLMRVAAGRPEIARRYL